MSNTVTIEEYVAQVVAQASNSERELLKDAKSPCFLGVFEIYRASRPNPVMNDRDVMLQQHRFWEALQVALKA